MKISLNWLQDFVDVKEYKQKPEALAQILTAAGLEVEEIENKAKAYSDVVVGLILKKSQHPNADKLSVCEVTTGEGVILQIVCGAKNHKADDRVIVALPGAVLPGDFAIKKSAIRGVESSGMLCSYKELGLADTSDGIAILPGDAPIGKSFAEYMGYDDVVFELKVTPNRADCLSHFGLAREISCLLNRPYQNPNIEFKSAGSSTKAQISLDVKAPELCPRYAGRYIQGVKIKASPDWLKKRLEAVGMKSINNVVDVTNYVMLELGQPLHAFDVRFLQGNKIIVDRAQAKEKFTTLDGTELTLKGEELMIRDGEKPVALAGVVGGLNSGVKDDTQNIFLEAAYFTPATVRKSARSFGINTDSGYRFSRGVDPSNTVKAMDRATKLILEVAGGEALSDHYDFYPNPIRKQPVKITAEIVGQRMGYKVESTALENHLTRLGCVVEKNGQELNVLPPSYRFDIEHEMDLVEEYARLHGYDHIPETLPAFKAQPSTHAREYILSQQVADILKTQGFSQAMNFAFLNGEFQKTFLGRTDSLIASGVFVAPKSVKPINPLNEELNTMRLSLLPGLFKNILHNYSYGLEVGRLFEVGQSFYQSDDGAYKEFPRLGLAAWGLPQGLWHSSQKHLVVFELKAALEGLLRYLNINSYEWVTYKDKGQCPMFLHPGQSSALKVEGKLVGFIGSLHPGILESNKIRTDVALAEFDLEALLKGQPRPYRSQSIAKFPQVERDLAFVMPVVLATGEVTKEIRKLAGAMLQSVEVFDIYTGDKLEKGKKSVAFKLIYQDKDRTLTDAEINDMQNKLIEGLGKQFSLLVR